VDDREGQVAGGGLRCEGPLDRPVLGENEQAEGCAEPVVERAAARIDGAVRCAVAGARIVS